MEPVDLVLTYVNGADNKWLKGYNTFLHSIGKSRSVNMRRFRDFGTLPFLLRGVEKYMPWIRKVYLVVQQESQVPSWLNRDEVNVVFHKDIIPEEYLPTYNSTCIEMFLCKIPGLSERFIYANDDMYPVGDMVMEDFYDTETGYPKLFYKLNPYNDSKNKYRHHLHNGEALVRRMLELEPNDTTTMHIGHNMHPILKSTWEKLWEKGRDIILSSLTPLREKNNINQDVCGFYQLLSDEYKESRRCATYVDLKYSRAAYRAILECNSQLLCLNDTATANYNILKNKIVRAFNMKFPDKSKYEL